jgi:hypothetical protein
MAEITVIAIDAREGAKESLLVEYAAKQIYIF